jgi:putative membrane protein
VTAIDLLPHLSAGLNGAMLALLIAGFAAIRRGRRDVHPKLMVSALMLGVAFLILYVVQYSLMGHRRFPGDDAVRTLFLAILTTHTILAVVAVPLILRSVYLAARRRFAEHRRFVHFTYPIWLYVSFTGIVIYWMNNHLRPGLAG